MEGQNKKITMNDDLLKISHLQLNCFVSTITLTKKGANPL